MLIEAVEFKSLITPEMVFMPAVDIVVKEKTREKEMADQKMDRVELDHHYTDQYYRAIIIQDRKKGIQSVLYPNGSCSTLGLIGKSAVYEIELPELEIKPPCKKTIIIEVSNPKPERVEVFNAGVMANESVRSRKQTRWWIGL